MERSVEGGAWGAWLGYALSLGLTPALHVGPQQVPVWEEQGVFPGWPSGLPGRAAVPPAEVSLRPAAEAPAGLAGTDALSTGTCRGSLPAAPCAGHVGPEVSGVWGWGGNCDGLRQTSALV